MMMTVTAIAPMTTGDVPPLDGGFLPAVRVVSPLEQPEALVYWSPGWNRPSGGGSLEMSPP